MQVRSGKVRYIGGSNFCGWQVQKSSDVSRSRLLERFCCMQNQYSLLARDNEWEVDEVCRLEGVAMLPWSPLKGVVWQTLRFSIVDLHELALNVFSLYRLQRQAFFWCSIFPECFHVVKTQLKSDYALQT